MCACANETKRNATKRNEQVGYVGWASANGNHQWGRIFPHLWEVMAYALRACRQWPPVIPRAQCHLCHPEPPWPSPSTYYVTPTLLRCIIPVANMTKPRYPSLRPQQTTRQPQRLHVNVHTSRRANRTSSGHTLRIDTMVPDTSHSRSRPSSAIRDNIQLLVSMPCGYRCYSYNLPQQPRRTNPPLLYSTTSPSLAALGRRRHAMARR